VKSKTKKAAKTSTETRQEIFEEILKLRGALKDDSALRLLREERKRERKRAERLIRLLAGH